MLKPPSMLRFAPCLQPCAALRTLGRLHLCLPTPSTFWCECIAPVPVLLTILSRYSPTHNDCVPVLLHCAPQQQQLVLRRPDALLVHHVVVCLAVKVLPYTCAACSTHGLRCVGRACWHCCKRCRRTCRPDPCCAFDAYKVFKSHCI